MCEKGFKWRIGSNSNLSFWNGKWLNFGTIRSLIEGPLSRGEEELLVKDVMLNGSWDLGMLSFDFNGLICSAILATSYEEFHRERTSFAGFLAQLETLTLKTPICWPLVRTSKAWIFMGSGCGS